MAGTAEPGDQFGAAFAHTVVTDQPDTTGIVAIASPGEDVGAVEDAGAVSVRVDLYEDEENWELVTQALPSLGAEPEAGDRFGAAIGVAPMPPSDPDEGAGWAALAVGSPGEDLAGTADAGTVSLIRVRAYPDDLGEAEHADVVDGTTLSQGENGLAGVVEPGALFGNTVGLLPDVANGLVFGAPGQSVGQSPRAGTITTYRTNSHASYLLSQDTGSAAGTAEAGDGFSRLPR